MADGDKQTNNNQLDDSNHPGMSPDLEERGRQLGHSNAYGGQSVGTGGHGFTGSTINNQPVGGRHALDQSQFTQKQLHPGMNPDPIERGRQLGRENAQGGRSVGTGGHGPSGATFGR